jgi:transglutaminase-like putative cysteine protease
MVEFSGMTERTYIQAGDGWRGRRVTATTQIDGQSAPFRKFTAARLDNNSTAILTHSVRNLLRALFVAAFVWPTLPGSVVVAETAAHIDIAPAPAWVKSIDADSVTIPKTVEVENGIDYVLVDCQSLMEPMSDFYHYARRVVNEHGLADAGEIKGEFDPSYQTFTLHWLRVKRDGVWQDRIKTDHFQLLRREENLDSQLLDGRYSAECHLQDLRVGDEIDFAYTVTGANPVFNGNYVTSFSTTWSSPVHLFSQRLITAPNRHLAFKSFADQLQPSVTLNPDQSQLLEWKQSEVPAVFEDDDLPDWYDTYGWVQLSEFPSWKAVIDWGLTNYQFDAPLSPELQAKIDEIAKKSTSPEDRALEAIRFVQDDIRYLGIEMGAGSYKPTPASETCAHRFGDCKDKAFLCVVMLRALGIEAYPALVSTDYRQDTDKLLPSPLAFDHAIVQLVVDNRTYWIDATREGQRGRLKNLYISDFKRALVLKPGNDALSSMTVSPESLPKELVTDTFTVKSVTDPTTLEVHSVFLGRSAEETRSDFADNSIEKIQKNYLDYYAKSYSKIKVAKSIRFQDFPDDNRFEVWEDYTIPDLWSRKTADVPWKAIFSPHIVNDAIGDLPSPQRTTPYHVNYPSDVSEDIEIHMFDDWSVDATNNDSTTPYFVFTDHPSCDKNVVHFRYQFKTLVPDILPENIADYHDQIKKLQDNLDYNLTYQPKVDAPPPKPVPFQPNWPVFGMAILVLAASCYAAFRIYLIRLPYPPPPIPDELVPYDGVNGWLILVIIGLFFRIGLNLYSLLFDYGAAWDAAKWNLLTVPGAASYDPLWAPTLLFEMAFTTVFVVMSILAIILLFQRRTIFPRIMITILLFALAFKIIDVALADQIPLVAKQQPGMDPDLPRVFFQAIIWVPYLLFAKRVRATFRR